MSRTLFFAVALLSAAGCRLYDIDEDGSVESEDCDDYDPNAFPGNDEVCDGIDNDCDGVVDDGVLVDFWTDADGDGFGLEGSETAQGCTAPEGFAANIDDCADDDDMISPLAVELCDGIDNDCDGDTDEDGAIGGGAYYLDNDGDTFGDPATEVLACSPPEFHVTVAGDCDDTDPDVYPGAAEVCNDTDDDCDGDEDELATDAPDWYLDADDDGFGSDRLVLAACDQPTGFVANDTDCDDTDAATFPGAAEVCDSVDRDCDLTTIPSCGSCLEILEAGQSTGDGVYEVVIASGPEDVYCDMTTDDGGWTLVQRTVWEWADSQQLLTGYSAWRDQTIGDPTPGNAYRMAGAQWELLNVDLDHMLVHRIRTTTGGACDPLYYMAASGTLTADAGTATLTGVIQNVSLFNSTELSTIDSGPAPACTTTFHGAPWFYGGCCSTCPTFQGVYWNDEPHPMMNYSATADQLGNTRTDVCTGDPPEQSVNGSNHYGVDAMEYFVR